MTEYSPDALLAEAWLKLDRLEPGCGIAFLEGEDDRRCLAERYIALEQVVVGEGKDNLIGAYERAESDEHRVFVFLADCDYDVPAHRLRPQSNLVVTRNPSLETDLIEAGLVSQLVQELIPREKWTGSAGDTAERITDSAIALAEGLGKLRLLARVDNVPIDFSNFRKNLRRYRKDGRADTEKMLDVMQGDPEQPDFDRVKMTGDVAALSGGFRVCDGHDLMEAIRIVLRDDFALEGKEVYSLDRILRASLGPQVFEQLEFATRVRRWEAESGRRILVR